MPTRVALLLGVACLLGSEMPWAQEQAAEAEAAATEAAATSPGDAAPTATPPATPPAAPAAAPASAETVTVREVRLSIDGLDDQRPLKDNVQAMLAVRQAAHGGERELFLLERLHRRAERDIRRALQPFGYYQPQVHSRFEVDGRNTLQLNYRVDPGPRTTLRRVDIRIEGAGEDDEVLQQAVMQARLEAGDPLLHERYASIKSNLSSTAFARGYFDVGFRKAEIRVEPEAQTADIELVLQTGPRYRVGDIRIEQSVLDDDLLRRYLDIAPGDWFSPQALLRNQFRLMDLGYFSRVDIEPLPSEAEAAVMPILVQPKYLASQRYRVGAGFGTDTGPRFSLGADFRRINRRGHWINFDGRASARKQTVGVAYNLPLDHDPGERLSLTSTYEREDFEDGRSTRYGAGISLIKQPGNWKRRIYLDLSRESFEVGSLERVTDLLIPGVSYERQRMDDDTYPFRGWSVFWDIHAASEEVVSSTSFLQTQIALRGILPIDDKSRLLTRAEYGATFIDDFRRLPLSERLYAGGDQSVRGYPFQGLGERDADNNVIGGRYLLVGSVEVDRLIWGNFGLAAFFDSGGAANNARPTLAHGVGMGVRYRSPVGAFRLDIAHPLSDDRSGIRLHIGIGLGL